MREKIAPEESINPISHDGVHDSLTFLASPSFFYEILQRDIARARRENSPLLLARFKLDCNASGLTVSDYEVGLINFAKAISQLTRESDVTARVGRFEFFTLLPVTASQGEGLIDRLLELWGEDEFDILPVHIQYIHGESALDFLTRLDAT